MLKIRSVLIGVFIICFLLIIFGDKLCTKNKPLPNADILIIEGWLPANILEYIHNSSNLRKYKAVIISGVKYDSIITDTINRTYKTKGPIFLGNGAIILTKSAIKKISVRDSSFTIKLFAKGTNCLGVNAHFTLFLNNKRIGESFTSEESRAYQFSISHTGILKNFILNFDNDIKVGAEDRNLIIDSLQFGNVNLSRNDFLVVRVGYPERYSFGFTSNAEKTYYYMLSLGHYQNLYFIGSENVQHNLTKQSAIACKDWINTKFSGNHLNVNIISLNFHSSRTYFTYRKTLKNNKIGIISMDNNKIYGTLFYNFKNIRILIEEYIGILVTLLT